ncbi:MAG: hypothetical protein A3K77_00865 [Euryarchaeota archaeon RBG_13_31_8]|nr:MAG: hypothetical protein A3K77_00865 [Euryarchaeota archaeon RBG_13_31_8]
MYHSALKKNNILSKYEPLSGPIKDSLENIVFKHDITDGVNLLLFKNADIIYIEPAWKDGFEEFNKRAETKKKVSYNDYLIAIRETIIQLELPTIVIMGKYMLNVLSPSSTIQTKIHGYQCLAGLWNINFEEESKDNFSIINTLTLNYNCVLDFCCGCGNTGKIFKEHGKNFIMSDLNGRCVTYIATEIMGTK